MSDRVELDVYSQVEPGWVVRVPDQRCPVLLVDGVAVYSFFALADSVARRAAACGCADAELLAETEELRDELDRLVRHYEAVAAAARLPLPYEPLDGGPAPADASSA